jgi:ATP-dependent exoDNAse (exonuclease V) beta subunit
LLRHKDFDTLLPEEFISEYESLRQMPLYELIERLYIIFSLSSLEGQSAYVCAFFDRLNDFLQDSLSPLTSQLSHHTSRLSPLIPLFLKEWNETISGKTIQSDEIHGIRIISIHKSKGLEFPHVIIPFCDWSLEHQGSLLWCQPGSAPFNDLPLAPVDYSSKSLLGTIYEPAYHHEHLQNTVDNLNLLYVAFTRASQSLIVLGKRNTSASSRSSLIEQVLHLLPDTLSNTTLEGLEPSGSPLILHSNSGFKVSLDLESPANEKLGNHKVQSFKNPFSITPSPLKIQVSSFAPHMDFRQSNRSMAFINGEDESDIKSYIQLGSILHEVFSTIRTTADIAPALKRLELEGILYDENNTSEKVISMLRKRLNNPKVRDWFSDKYKLYNECTILKLEGGQLQERRPDRVMTDGKNWIIVDFKFGSPKPEYELQVREYMSLIREMHPAQEITIQGYLWFVYSNKIVEVS